MSVHDYNTVKRLTLPEIIENPANKALVAQYAREHCSGLYQQQLLKLAA